MRSFWLALRETGKLFGSQWRLWVPFLVAAVCELVLLLFVWLAPHPPFSRVLAPPIRYFFGDRVLHYPAHLWFLFHVMKHAHLVASTLVGAFMTGIACVMVAQARHGLPMSLREALVSKQVPYVRMVILWLITWGLAKISTEGMASIGKMAWVAWTSLGLLVVLQTLLIYAFPAAVYEGSPWWKAVGQGVRETIRYPFSTLIIVAVPSVALIAFSFIVNPSSVSAWMAKTAPEIVFAFMAARLVISMIGDAVITVAAAQLWWAHRAPQSLAQPASNAASTAPVIPRHLASIVTVLMALILVGCSANYTGERLFWKAQKVSAELFKGSKEARKNLTDEQLRKVVEAYSRVVEKAPGTIWAARAQLEIGSFYGVHKDFEKVREVFAALLQNYNRYPDLCLKARIGIAKSYEIEQNWDEAVKAYQTIADYHPWSPSGLQVPLYLARLFETRGERAEANAALERTVRTYTKLIPDAPSPELALQVKGLLSVAYRRLEQWDKAVAILEELAQVPNANRPMILYTLAAIYEAKLANPEKATELFTTLAKEFPDTQFGKVAKQRLEGSGGATAASAATDSAGPLDATGAAISGSNRLAPGTPPPSTSTTAR